MPNTISVERPRSARSANALTMMVVLEMATAAPAYRLASTDQPSTRPASWPNQIMKLVSSTAMITTVQPARISRRKWNSSPSENMSRITPSSESVRTVASSATSGTGRCGPMMSPASM
jgi:hypothetical protein